MKHWIEKEKPGNGGKKGDIDILGNKFGKPGENAGLRVLHGIQKLKKIQVRIYMEVLVAFTRTV